MTTSRTRAARAAVVLATAAVMGTLAVSPASALCPADDPCEPIRPRITTTTKPPTTTTTVAPSVDSGTFKVSIDGFNVNRKTHDTWFNWDGKADEVFHQTRVNVIDPGGNVLMAADRSLFPDGKQVMGDVNNWNNRIKAGSASDLGGIETGDIVNQPFTLIQNLQLAKGGNKLALTLSLNEWDNTESDWVGPWIDLLNANQGPLAQAVAAFVPKEYAWVTTATSLGVQAVKVLHGLAPDSGTRPIGIQQTAPGSSDYTYNPPVVVLDFNSADLLSRNDYYGLGKGVFEVRLADTGEGEGNYVLRLRVTRTA